MIATFLIKCADAFVQVLPVALVRVLFLTVVIGSAVLHFAATGRIAALERSQDKLQIQNGHVLRALDELTVEVRGYRDDVRAENRALKQCVMLPSKD